MADPQRTEPGRPPAGRSSQRWIAIFTIVWGLVLLGGIVWSAFRGEATVREQTTVAQALPVVDRAAAELAAAATADGLAVVAVSDFGRSGECSVTVLRDGVQYRRTVTALVAPGTEQVLLERVGARLPAAYRASVRTGAAPRLVADAGFYVGVTGTVVAPGQIRFDFDTGRCRAEGDLPETRPGSAEKPSIGRAGRLATAAEVLLGQVGVAAQRWSTREIACPAGTLTTVEAVGAEGALPPSLLAQEEAVAGALDAFLKPARPGALIAATSELLAYQATDVGVGARAVNSRLVVTATSSCA
jgi:hypothetical protein